MIRIKAVKLLEADAERGAVTAGRVYTSHEGLECKEIHHVQKEGDYTNEHRYRISPDNGKTYGEWQVMEREKYSECFGEDEMITEDTKRVYNPVHGHYVFTRWTRYFEGGHEAAYRKYWQKGDRSFYDHQSIAIAKTPDGAPDSVKLVKYEEGSDFSREDPRNPSFLERNQGFLNTPIVLKNGDIAVPVGIPIDRACELLGIDVDELFPSVPHICRGVIVARGSFNRRTGEYDLTFSSPVVISDLKSSRGFDEPILVELTSGRVILVMRGSNVQYAPWNTRIEKGTPSYKWFSSSDDGCKTFTAPAPWRFDSGEPVYSAATISEFIRSRKTGKLYWVGNVSDEHALGNFPRYPLHIAEVDDLTGELVRDTLTVIDTRREGETEKIQLSNFSLVEDRESLDLELSLTKIGQFDEKRSFLAETWRYFITVE